MDFLRRVWVLLTVTTLISTSLADDARARHNPWSTRSAVFAPRAMVCTSHPLATQAGLEVLRSGGSAVDAAVAANACLGLMEPTGCGIGGDLFALVWDPASRRLHGLMPVDARPAA